MDGAPSWGWLGAPFPFICKGVRLNEYVMALDSVVTRHDGGRDVIRKGDLAHRDHPVVRANPAMFGPVVVRFDVEKREVRPDPVKRGPGRPRKG